MQVTVETGEGLERRMRVDLPSEAIQEQVEKRLHELVRSVRLPGFRPGKVPLKLLRQRFANQVEREVFGDLVQSSFASAVAERSLRLAGAPHIEPEVHPAAQRYGFTATFEVLPQIELVPLTGQVVKRPVTEITDADLEAMIERLRVQRKTWVPVERPAQSGDRLTVSFTGTLEGESEPFAGGTAAAVPVEIGSARMLPGFEDGLVGAGTGETRTLDLRFPDGYQRAELSGRAVRFEVTVDAVAAPELPAVDEAFARAFGVADGEVERLRADVRANMARELKTRIQARTKEGVMNLLVASHQVEIPKVLLAEEVRALKGQMRETIGAPTMDLPDTLFEESARRRVVLGLLIGELIRHNGIKAEPSRVRAAIEELASTYEDPKEVVDYYYADRKRLAPVESLVLEDQVVEWVLSQVTVEDEETSFAQLTEPASVATAGT
ncbi:trigger factor [uncultured Thiodictyon sp.]|jgi:trigger factor|uniref:trigger factor n=1 Tax=uncultured Thiodictyon sp. TaxID=1846217 RepID=UPI0025D80F30|nr:trigger factor [uncultured Thiodictyon sp.]